MIEKIGLSTLLTQVLCELGLVRDWKTIYDHLGMAEGIKRTWFWEDQQMKRIQETQQVKSISEEETQETPQQVTRKRTDLMALAALFQQWAELCQRQSGAELSHALSWYLKGREDAHAIDAVRVRELVDSTVGMAPPDTPSMFAKAYEAVLEMMVKIGGAENLTKGEGS